MQKILKQFRYDIKKDLFIDVCSCSSDDNALAVIVQAEFNASKLGVRLYVIIPICWN